MEIALSIIALVAVGLLWRRIERRSRRDSDINARLARLETAERRRAQADAEHRRK